ncbi:hypothetical protein ACT4UL_14875, partial [Bacillus sp. HC-TM]
HLVFYYQEKVVFGLISYFVVQFCEPIGEGLVLEHLNKNGEYPFAVEFKGGNKREHEVLGSLYIY